MEEKIRVVILDDHQAISDGYRYRLEDEPDIHILASLNYGDELEPTLIEHEVDVLLLDIEVPISPKNPNPYPILFLIPKILQKHPDLCIIIISMHAQSTMISTLMEAGVRGYILKEDHQAIRGLAALIRTIASGNIYLSQHAYEQLKSSRHGNYNEPLTSREIEVLSLAAAYPDDTTADLAMRLDVAQSTIRNTMHNIYLKLGVHSRTAAIAKAKQVGFIPPV